MKIYIAGKITGDPEYQMKFESVEKSLKQKGHSVMNPAVLPPDGFEYEEYMRICFAMIEACQAVYFLTDWIYSNGAQIEYAYAKALGKKILYQ